MRPELEHLIDLMFDNKRQYQIPVYQRNYDWKKENCTELFDDILMAYKNERSHFLGIFVQIQEDEQNGIKQFIIIDGQQRTTSIYLLLKALYDCCDDGDDKVRLQGLLFNNSDVKEFSKDEKNKLKLKPIKTDNTQFLLLMANKQDEMDKTSNIYLNYLHFVELIKKALKENYSISNILKGLKYLEIVMISLKEDSGDDPQVIFERINSTGVDLTLADLIRNYVLMTDGDRERLFEEYWIKIETEVGKDYLNDFFVHYLWFKLTDSVTSKNAYQVFKKYADKSGLTNEEILIDFKRYSKYYNVFIREDLSNYSKETNNLLYVYRVLNQSTIFPFLFSIFDDKENGVIDEPILDEVLFFFLNYTIRRAVTGVPTNSLRGLYKTLYKRIFNDSEKLIKENYLNSIYSFMATLSTTKDAVPNDTSFKDSLIYGNTYKNGRLCKYILSICENGMASKEKVSIDESITIEHIMPQNKNDLWQDEIGKEDYPVVYEKYLHTLGNLTLTGYNSELSDKSFSEKKTMIKDKSKFNKLNEDVVSRERWNEKNIISRANRLSDETIEVLKLPQILTNVPVQSSKDNKHTVYDGADLRGSKPTSFIILGDKKEVSSFRDMLEKVLSVFYDLDPEKIEMLAKERFTLPQATKVSLTYDKSELRSAIEIDDTGIYAESNLSAGAVVRIIRALIGEFDLSHDDFVFYTQTSNEDYIDSSDNENDGD